MSERVEFYPKEENIGHNCEYWSFECGCLYPKAELVSRRSCEGVIDDICLFVKDGREPRYLSQDQRDEIKQRIPDQLDKSYLPPGDII